MPPRTPVLQKPEGMEGIACLRRGWACFMGSGGSVCGSKACGVLGGDGEDGEDNCNPPHARAITGSGGSSRGYLSMCGAQLSSPYPPSPPVCPQPYDFRQFITLHSLQSILSLLSSILSIPSLKKSTKLRVVSKNSEIAKSGKGLSA